MRNLKFAGVALASLFFVACSDNNGENLGGNEGQTPVITTRVAAFDGSGQAVEGENEINNMQACLFENGVMTKVYTNLVASDGGYNVQLDRYAGNLYMLGNTAGVINLEQLQAEAITEADWLKKTFALQNGQTTNFFTGVLNLSAQQQSTVQSLTLKRGVARFDMVVDVAGAASVESMTLTNVAQSAYLFPQGDAALSPEDVVRKNVTRNFQTALTQNTPGVLYVYEQANAGMEISVVVRFDGGSSRTLTKAIEGDLKRNTVYTVTVRKDYIDVTFKPSLEDWEQGGDTELAPRVK